MTDRYTPTIWTPPVKQGKIEVENSKIREFFQPEIIEKIKNFVLLSREIVDGALSGLHKSYHLGQSIEFSQHKEYSQGDDLKDLDWKAFAKSDKYFIKQYERETNARVIILVDASQSMNFGTVGITKFEYAKQLSGALSFLFLNQYDEAGLVVSSGKGIDYLAPHRGLGFLKDIASRLLFTETTGSSSLQDAIRFMSEKLWRGISIIISDLITDEDTVIKEVKYLHKKKNNVLVLQLLDPAELNLDFHQSGLFRGLENDGEVYTDPEIIREKYKEEISRAIHYYRSNFEDDNIYYFLIETSTSPVQVISELIAKIK
jgi:uncharacterized protein (DUF58 family)